MIAPVPVRPSEADQPQRRERAARPRAALGRFGAAVLVALLLLNIVVLVEQVSPIRAIVAFPIVIFLPGQLTLRAGRILRRRGADTMVHAVAISLLWLLALSLVLGSLPLPGGMSVVACLLGFDMVIVGLLAGVVLRERHGTGGSSATAPAASQVPALRSPVDDVPAPEDATSDDAPTSVLYFSPDDSSGRPSLYVSGNPLAALRALPAVLLIAPGLAALAVVLAVAGAMRLNAGGSAALTMLAFAAGALALLLVTLGARGERASRADRSSLQSAAAVVFLLGLTVLLATSLRGVGPTGHDIKIEFRMFQETLASGSWRPGGDFANYHACLSITTLPSLLCRLLGVAPLDIFRVCYQLIFAAVPVGVLLIARRMLPTPGATLAAGLFIAFPAFVNDMPMLNRQEMALLFFTVAILALVERQGSRWQRTALFSTMVAGVTVSHYTSMYIAAGLVLAAWLLLWLRRLARRVTRVRVGGAVPDALAWPVVIAVLVLPLTWGLVTGSGSSLFTSIEGAVSNFRASLSASSDAVGYSFLPTGAPKISDEEALRNYLSDQPPPPSRAGSTVVPAGCPVWLRPAEVLPVTEAGRALQATGVDPGEVSRFSRVGAVALFELGAVVGALAFWIRTRRSITSAHIVAVLGSGSLVILAAAVFLPGLSVDYGVLRLYQQLLIVLAPPAVFVLGAVVTRLGAAVARVFPAVLVTACLITTSGLLPQVIGAYQPQLNLNDSGSYFRAYYVSADAEAAAAWSAAHIPTAATLVTDSANAALLSSFPGRYSLVAVAPGNVPSDAYVQVKVDAADEVDAVAIWRERVLGYAFSLRCVTADRSLLYAVGDYRIYGPAR